MSYDPNSSDAMLSRIIQRLDQQSKDTADHRAELLSVLGEVKAEVKLTNGRVRGLERWRDVITAKVVGISVGASAVFAAISWLFKNVIL